MINEKDALALMEVLYPYFIKKYKEDNSFKQTAQIVNGTVVSINGANVEVRLNPYDTNTITVKKDTTITVAVGNSVQIMYYDSLKTARIIAKN